MEKESATRRTGCVSATILSMVFRARQGCVLGKQEAAVVMETVMVKQELASVSHRSSETNAKAKNAPLMIATGIWGEENAIPPLVNASVEWVTKGNSANGRPVCPNAQRMESVTRSLPSVSARQGTSGLLVRRSSVVH
jgi:hypothetical protein